jgi:glycosyltransferase involved in cell wall biosynthesis
VERYLTYLAPELARRGHTVSVVGGDPDAMARALVGTGVATTPASTTAQVFRGALASPRPDVLHSHMTAADAAGVAASLRIARPVVSTLHFAGGRGHSRLTRATYGVLRTRLARETAVSSYVAAGSGGRPIVLPTGIPRPTPPAADDPPVAREPVVLVAQRLEPEKRTEIALHAWAESGLAERGWQLVVAGRGSQADALRRLAERLGHADAVAFVGHDPDLSTRMARASILLAPTPNEAFGLTVVEAMAHELPVVAAAGGGHLETVGPVSPDALYPADDPRAAADRLRQLADSADDRLALGAKLRDRFESEYTIEHHVDRLELLYDEVSSGAEPASRSSRP